MSGFRNRLLKTAIPSALLTTIRIDQNLTDPAAMITRIVDEGGIEAIRANSHRYVGVFDSSADLMSLRQLDDNDGTKYLDGTTADITTLGNDVWMKLPQFWYKAEEYETDVWDISFAYGGKPDDTWKEWDGKDLIGVYEAFVSASLMYSTSNRSSTGSTSQTDFKTYARNRGNGFALVKWKHHCMMASLFYTMYIHTNSQKKIGSGTNSYAKITGETNPLGMVDTVGGGNGDTMSINFWGIENWWGNKSEWVDNVTINYGTWSVESENGTERIIGNGGVVSVKYISKLLFGDNMDLMPIEATASSTTGYCDLFNQTSQSNRSLLRSGDRNNPYYGTASCETSASGAYIDVSIGTRLSYRGDYIITD